MTEQELGNTIWGLGQSGVRFSSSLKLSTNGTLVLSILKQEYSLQRQAVVAILQGFSCSGDLTWKDINIDVRSVLLRSVKRCLDSDHDNATTAVDDAKFASNIINCLGN